MKQSLNLIQSEALTQILPNPPQLLSDCSNWSDFLLAYYHQHPGCESPASIFKQHALEIVDDGSWSHHERRMDNVHLSYQLRSGETCFCPAQTRHWTTWDKPLSFTVIAFEPALFVRLSQELESDRIEFVPRWQVFDSVIQAIVAALRADLAAGCPAGRLYGESFGTSLAIHIVKQFSVDTKVTELRGISKSKQAQVLDFIEAHLETDIRLADLAKVAGISKFYFCRLFKRTMTLTPHQYVIRRRIERAKQLLKHSNLKIVDVALSCGFANQSHFSLHFRRIVGVSPKAFRQC